MQTQRVQWSSRTKIVVSLLLLAFAVYLLYRFSVILTPLILAVIVAYILTPLTVLFQKRLHIPRVLAILLSYLLLIVVLITLPLLIVPPLASQLAALNVDIQRFLLALEALLGHQYSIGGQVIDLQAVFQQMVGSLQGFAEPVFGQTLNFVFDVITSLIWMVFIFVVSFYLIKDNEQVRQWLESLVPPDYHTDYVQLRGEIGHIWGAFFRGQVVLALVVALIFTIIGFILGLPFALAMGVFAGLLEFLPSLGHAIWLTTASLLALFIGSATLPIPNWIFMLLIIGLHLVFEQFDLNYLIPRIIGRSVHLPPVVVILGIVGGAAVAGVLGILLAAPTIASARVLGRYFYANLFDMDPFPSSVVKTLPPPDPRWWHHMASNPAKSSDPPPGKT
ncbi:MAG: AI-2E family transporter [Anaerolineales bacterium]|jgi:predicted PurR-regulated permease PerM